MVQRLKEQRQRSLSDHQPEEHEGLEEPEEYGLEGPQEPEESITKPESVTEPKSESE